MKLILKTWAKALLLNVCGLSLMSSTQAQTFTWRGTNSTTWSTPGNWLALSVCPFNTTTNARLAVNNGSINFSNCVYDATLGTTILSGGGGTGRALVIGSGSLGNGAMTINGGTLICTNTGIDIVENSANNTGSLTINGGNFLDYDPGVQLGIGGANNSTANFTVNGGNVLVGTFIFNVQRGTINYNGGITTFSNITATISGANNTCTNNFNGGTVQPRVNTTAFIPAISQANVRNGGAVVDTAGLNITIVQPLAHSVIPGDAAIDGGLTKNGNGTLTLNGAPAYTGPTRVNAGRLTTPLPTASSSLILAGGSRFTPALTNAPWFAGSAALTNTVIDFNFGSFSANPNTNASLYLTNLAISGSVTCNIAGTGFPVTNITLLSYGSKSGGGSFVLGSLPSGAVATLNDDGANVTINITAPSIQNLIWSTGDGVWKTTGGLDWNGGTAQYLEYPSGVNDVVTFDDTASGTVTITGQVNPSATTVNVTSSFYTFAGAGSIGGTNGIAKLGTSTLEIDNANNFTGPVTISGGSGTTGGTLFVNNVSALGATNGTVTVNGPANTLEIGIPGGNGITVSNKTVVINGTGVGGAKGALRGAAVAAGQTNIWAGPVVIATDTSRIGTEDNGNLVVSGPITDNGANLGVLLRPGISGTLTIAGTGSSYAYTRTYGDTSTSFIKLGANNAFATNALQLGNGNVDLNGFNQTVASIIDFSLSTVSTVLNNGAAPSTLTINTGTNTASSFSTVTAFTDGTSVLNIVKTGKGTEGLSGANVTYSGTTTILDGQLNLTSANPMNTAITVAAGGTLGGEGTTTNSLTLQANSILAFDPSTPGSFTANTIDATASPIKVLLVSTAPTNAPSLVLSSVNGITGSAANFQVVGSRGGTFVLTNGNTQLMFMPSTVTASLVWKGNNGVNPTYWNTLTTTNWSNSGNPDAFYAGDQVTFDDTASTYSVAITGGTVQPSSVTVNATNNYTFTGTMGGGGTVTKGGTGTLFFANNNSYTGLTVITNGTVSILTSAALGTTASGTVISGNGTLDIDTGANLANTINIGAEVLTISGNGFGGQGAVVNNSPAADQINAVQQIVMAGNASIGGVSRWDMRGTGNALDMQSTNTLTKVGGNYIALVSTVVNNPGNIVVNGGTLGIQLAANLGGSSANTLTVNSGGRLEMYQLAANPAWTLVLNSNAMVNPDNGFGGWDGPVTVNGPAILQADATLTINGAISGSGSLIKTGSSSASLNASNAYTGNTTVSAGTLSVAYPSFASASTISVSNSAVLNLNFTGTNTVAALELNGVSQPAGVYDAITGAPYITGSGALEVVPSSAPTLTFTSSGGSLQITFTGGTLQAQTNSLGSGLGTNWVDYSGSSPVTITINPANGSVFFRVKQ